MSCYTSWRLSFVFSFRISTKITDKNEKTDLLFKDLARR